MADLSQFVNRLRSGEAPKFPSDANSLSFAQTLDSQDSISHLRDEFIIPTKASLKKTALNGSIPGEHSTNGTTNGSNGSNGANGHGSSEEQGIYFVGNSLGAQPKAIRTYINAQLETWASIGVAGHFKSMDDSPLTSWQDMAEDCAKKSADLVGSSPHEIVIMNTLTMNLHMMMASFYKPTEKRHKIILEWRPFPSDYYAIESQMVWHGLDPEKSMVKIEPDESSLIPTERILKTIDEHADETALLLLPGIQYYSGQLFDMPRITAHAKAKGITVGWDLAHAAGNVELKLHDWDVDFACWCTYKYINAGPGSIGGAFVHEKHGKVEWPEDGTGRPSYRPRLMGWYGGDKSVRFLMDNKFVPTPGAQGYQASNPSAIDLASLSGALSVFNKTTMHDLRSKALVLTAYAEYLMDQMQSQSSSELFKILTPRDPAQRGTQLSVMLANEEMHDNVSKALEENGVMCDKRKPNVIRVAPVPLYSRFEDVWRFMQILRAALGLKET